MRRFFAPTESFTDGGVQLDADETRHLRDVLRLKTGEEVSVFDGTGREYRCTIREIGKKTSMLSVGGDRPVVTRIAPRDHYRRDRAERRKVRSDHSKSVELGVTRLILVKHDPPATSNPGTPQNVWIAGRIAMEATKQSAAKLMQIASHPSSRD